MKGVSWLLSGRMQRVRDSALSKVLFRNIHTNPYRVLVVAKSVDRRQGGHDLPSIVKVGTDFVVENGIPYLPAN